MNKNTLIVLVIAVIVVIAGAVYFLQQPKGMQNNMANQPTNNEANTVPGNGNVTIQNFSFNPAELTVKKGSTVTWTNEDSTQHVISGSGFRSDPLNKGQSFSFTFDTAGTFDYICAIHTYMKGSIIVQ